MGVPVRQLGKVARESFVIPVNTCAWQEVNGRIRRVETGQVEVNVYVEVDLNAVAWHLAERAARSKSNKATALSGAIVVRKVR